MSAKSKKIVRRGNKQRYNRMVLLPSRGNRMYSAIKTIIPVKSPLEAKAKISPNLKYESLSYSSWLLLQNCNNADIEPSP